MSDSIEIKGLAIFAKHGVFKEENKLGQKFLVDVTLFTDLSQIGKTDNIQDGICYKEVIELTNHFVKNNLFSTLEGLAENLVHYLLNKYQKILSIALCIQKPHAAIDASFDTIAVRIKRKKPVDTIHC